MAARLSSVRMRNSPTDSAIERLNRLIASGAPPARILSVARRALEVVKRFAPGGAMLARSAATALLLTGHAREALSVLKSVPFSRTDAEILLRRGQCLAMLGKPAAAAEFFRDAAIRFRKGDLPERALVAEAERGATLRLAGRPRLAAKILEGLLPAFPVSAGPNAAGLRLNLAHALVDLGRFAAAFGRLEEARTIFADGRVTHGAAHCESTAGALRLSLGLHREAGERFRRAARLHASVGDRLAEARDRENLGLAELAEGRCSGINLLEEAARHYRAFDAVADEARVVANLLLHRENLSILGRCGQLWPVLSRGGARRESAFLASAVALAEGTRGGKIRRWADRAVAAARASGSPLREAEAALAVARGRPAARRKAIGTAIHRLADSVDEPVWALLPWTGGLAGGLWTRLFAETVGTGDARLLRRLFSASRCQPLLASYLAVAGEKGGVDRARFAAKLGVATSWASALRRRSSRPAGSATNLELYLDTDGNACAMVTTGGSNRGIFVSAGAIKDSLERFENEIMLAESDPSAVSDRVRIDSARMAAAQLGRAILLPLSDLLVAAKEIVVVPSGAANRLPILAMWECSGLSLAGMRTEIHHALAPSSGFKRLSAGRGRALVVLGEREDLPEAEVEAQIVARATGARIIDGVREGKAAVLAAYRGARFIHYIGHAVNRRANPFLSFLDLGAGGALFALDLACSPTRKRPKIVLSACSAADGRGGIGMVAALLASGACEVVAARWKVSDSAAPTSAVRSDVRMEHPWSWAGWERWLG